MTRLGIVVSAIVLPLIYGCADYYRSFREQTDEAAARDIQVAQTQAFGTTQPFTIARPADLLRRRLLLDADLPYAGAADLGVDQLPEPAHWPEPGLLHSAPTPVATRPGRLPFPMVISLTRALQIGAANHNGYQQQKEDVYLAALDLQVERHHFDLTYLGIVNGLAGYDASSDRGGMQGGGETGIRKTFKTGSTLAAKIGVDLVKLLTNDRSSAYGVFADFTATVPLLAGAGEYVVNEPLTQSQRNVWYRLLEFDRYRKTFALQVATDYYQVLLQLDRIDNAEQNVARLKVLVSQTQALELAGRKTAYEVDQARQDYLNARNALIGATLDYRNALDRLKKAIGLPVDAPVLVDRAELATLEALAVERFGQSGPQAFVDSDPSIPEVANSQQAKGNVKIALQRREDLRVAQGRVLDQQRKVAVAANALLPTLDLVAGAGFGGSRGLGSAGSNIYPRFNNGDYSVSLALDLPWNKTAQSAGYRARLIELERSVYRVQDLANDIKQQVRSAMRDLHVAGQTCQIQSWGVKLAKRRVEATDLALQAGRAETRDVLDANRSLLSAQDDRMRALVNYRLQELKLQVAMGVLMITEEGTWREFEAVR